MYVIPSILNRSPVLIVDVTVIVPVAVEHVGCVTDAVGAVGVTGCAAMVVAVIALVHPDPFLTVTL